MTLHNFVYTHDHQVKTFLIKKFLQICQFHAILNAFQSDDTNITYMKTYKILQFELINKEKIVTNYAFFGLSFSESSATFNNKG